MSEEFSFLNAQSKKIGWYFYNMPLWDLMLHSVPLVLCWDFFPSFNRVAMLFRSGWMIGLLHFLLQCSAAFCQFSQARLTLFSSLSSVSWYKVLPVSGTLHLQQTFISFTHKDTQGTKKKQKQTGLCKFIYPQWFPLCLGRIPALTDGVLCWSAYSPYCSCNYCSVWARSGLLKTEFFR